MSYLISAAERLLPFTTRRDLDVVPVRFSGESCYVVSDPVTLENYQLTSAEHFLLEKLRHEVSLVDLQRDFHHHFPGRRVSFAQLQQFIDQLYQQRLVSSNRSGQGPSLWRQRESLKRRLRVAAATNWLALRLGGAPAGPWIEPLYRIVGPLFSPLGCAAIAALAFYALHILAVDGRLFFSDARSTLDEPWRDGALPWIAALVGVKFWHELGHAIACRHFGGSCRKIGVLLLAGMPTLYCDVSDAWRLPDKWRRMAVASGGMIAELIAAAACVVVWRHAESVVLARSCCRLAIVCSVGTVLINANPLLRYDGYYLLSDWTEIPNLAQRSHFLIRSAWRNWFLGEPLRHDPLLSAHKRRGLWCYAVISRIYLALLLTGLIATFVLGAKSLGWERAAWLLLAVMGLGWGARRLATLVRFLKRPGQFRSFRWLRFALLVCTVATALGAVQRWPVTRRVTAPLKLTALDEVPLFASAAGRLAFVVESGSLIEEGQEVARLVDPDLELAVERHAGLLRTQSLRCAQLAKLRGSDPETGRALPAALVERDATARQLDQWKAQMAQMSVRARIAGRLIAPQRRDEPPLRASHDATRLPTWGGTPLDSGNLGAWIDSGTLIGAIAPSDQCIAWAAVGLKDVGAVAPGQRARMLFTALPTTVVTGVVRNVATSAQSNWADRSRTTSRTGERAAAHDRYHVVEIELLDPPPHLLPGVEGVAKIETYRTTFGELVRRILASYFS